MKSMYTYILMVIGAYMSIYIWSISFAQTSHLWNIYMEFCNYNQAGNESDLVTQALKKLPICIQFTNTAKQSLTLGVEFVDAVITDDTFKHRACNAPDRPKTQFADFIQTYDHTFIIGPWETIKKTYTIQYAAWFQWLSHWCVLYNVPDDIPKDQTMTVTVRSAKFIDILVTTGEVKQMINISPSPTLQQKEDEYVLNIGIINKGNVEEKTQITSVLSNILGYKKEFIFDVIVPANTGIVLTSKSFVLPKYGWVFLLSSKLSYTPQFNFNITDGKQPSEVYAGGTKNMQHILFVRNLQSGIAILIIVLFIWGIIRIFYRKKERNTQKSQADKVHGT